MDNAEIKETLNRQGLSANIIKLIAIMAMILDHAAWLFLPLQSVAGECCHIIGRIVFPVFAYFLVEGFHHTRNVKKYIIRLLVFALISHFAYAFCFGHPYLPDFSKGLVDTTSVLWGLSLGLIALAVYRSEKLARLIKVLLLVLLTVLSIPSDWSWVTVALPLTLEMNRGDFKKQMLWMTVICWCYAIGYCIVTGWTGAYQFAIVLAIPLLARYDGTRGRWKGMKWFFYIIYPLHLIILGVLKLLLH